MENQAVESIKSLYPVLISGIFVTLASTAWKQGVLEIFRWFKKQLTTSLFISSNNWAYYIMMEYLDNSQVTKKVRVLRFFNGKWGEERSITTGIGCGTHLLKIKGKRVLVHISEQQTFFNDEKLGIDICIFGRNQRFFDELKKELYHMKNYRSATGNEIMIYTFHAEGYWKEAISTEKRRLETVFIKKKDKETICDFIENFYNNKEWYCQKGIPYQAGILLYGRPGTGKSSLIKALAGKYNRNVCFLKASELNKINEAITDLPRNSVLVIEDIDSNPVVNDRGNGKENTTASFEGNMKDGLNVKIITLSDVLNSLDGLLAIPGRLLFITTNHLDKIDPALLRPGRIDLKVELGCIDNEVFRDFVTLFYGMELNGAFNVKEDITVSDLQNAFLVDKLSGREMLERFTEMRGATA